MELEGSSRVTLHLLDSAQGHPIQTWTFRDCDRLCIGRAAGNEIVLTDPKVSRLHAELLFVDGNWVLHSRGTNGTQIDGVTVAECRLADRTIFQLGSNGPSFQFVTLNDTVSELATIENIDPGALDFLMIDEQRKMDSVREIAESDRFRELREQADRLKQNIADDEQGGNE